MTAHGQGHRPARATTRERLRGLWQAARKLLDPEALHDTRRSRRILARNVRVFFMVARLEVVERVQLHAEALTYATLLSVVPFLAVVLAIFKGFGTTAGLADKATELILANVSGSPEQLATLVLYVKEFVGKVDAGQIGVVSVLILIWSVLTLLSHIETSINAVFGITTQRPFVRRMLTYWAVLTFGPLLLAASFGLTAGLQSSRFASAVGGLGGLWGLLVAAAPIVVTWVAFTVMYLVVPNTRVRFWPAVGAAILAGSVWNLGKFGYAWYAKNAVTQQVIYGSLAVIPLFVLWLYASWLLVLFGAQLTFAFQHAATYRREDQTADPSHAFVERAACRLFLEIARDFQLGRPPVGTDSLVARLGMPQRLLTHLTERLAAGGLLRATEPDGGLVPGRDLGTITVHTILEQIRRGGGAEPSLIADEARAYFDRVLDEVDRERLRVAGAVTFRELASQFEAEGETHG